MKREMPCAKHCPGRSGTCHATCERYKAYRAKMDAEREEREKKANIAWQIRAFEMEKYRRIKNSK